MQNWTDKIIHWNQLPGTEVKRLIATWGMSPLQIANYDKKHGFVNKNTPHETGTNNPVDFPKSTAPAKKAPTKKVAKAPVRGKYVGKDGEVQFLEHRNAWVGFFGGRRVVIKSTKEKCLEALRKDYNLEV